MLIYIRQTTSIIAFTFMCATHRMGCSLMCNPIVFCCSTQIVMIKHTLSKLYALFLFHNYFFFAHRCFVFLLNFNMKVPFYCKYNQIHFDSTYSSLCLVFQFDCEESGQNHDEQQLSNRVFT